MRIAIVGLMVGVLASVACGGIIPAGWLEWTQTDLGGGLTGYTLSVDDGVTTGSWACELTFTGVGPALINQLKGDFLGTLLPVDLEEFADIFDSGDPGYTKALDSWVFTPFAGIGPDPQFAETASSYYVHAGTPGATDVGATDVAYVVSDGLIGWEGTISRGGLDYDTAGEVPEPATLVVLGLGGLAALLRRRR